MAAAASRVGARDIYVPIVTDVIDASKGVLLIASGGFCLGLAGTLKTMEFFTGQKSNLLLITDDTAAFYTEMGKNLLKEGVVQILPVSTGIVIGLVFSAWLQRDL